MFFLFFHSFLPQQVHFLYHSYSFATYWLIREHAHLDSHSEAKSYDNKEKMKSHIPLAMLYKTSELIMSQMTAGTNDTNKDGRVEHFDQDIRIYNTNGFVDDHSSQETRGRSYYSCQAYDFKRKMQCVL